MYLGPGHFTGELDDTQPLSPEGSIVSHRSLPPQQLHRQEEEAEEEMEEIFEEWRQWVERHQGHKPGLTDVVTSTPRSKPLESVRRKGKIPYPKDQPGFSSSEAEDVPPPPLPPRLNRPAREREPQAAQGYMISDIRPSNADTRQEYATDTVATRPGIIPSHAATRPEMIPSHAATRPEMIPSHGIFKAGICLGIVFSGSVLFLSGRIYTRHAFFPFKSTFPDPK